MMSIGGNMGWIGTAARLIPEVLVSHALHSNCTPFRGARGVPLFFQVSRYSPNQHLGSLNCLTLKCRATSQAGRRRFESGLPLHLFNNLQASLKIVYLD